MVANGGCQLDLTSSSPARFHVVSPCGLDWASSQNGGVLRASVERESDRQADRQTQKSCNITSLTFPYVLFFQAVQSPVQVWGEGKQTSPLSGEWQDSGKGSGPEVSLWPFWEHTLCHTGNLFLL